MVFMENIADNCLPVTVDVDLQCNQTCVFWWIFQSLFSSNDALPEKRGGSPADIKGGGGSGGVQMDRNQEKETQFHLIAVDMKGIKD